MGGGTFFLDRVGGLRDAGVGPPYPQPEDRRRRVAAAALARFPWASSPRRVAHRGRGGGVPIEQRRCGAPWGHVRESAKAGAPGGRCRRRNCPLAIRRERLPTDVTAGPTRVLQGPAAVGAACSRSVNARNRFRSLRNKAVNTPSDPALVRRRRANNDFRSGRANSARLGIRGGKSTRERTFVTECGSPDSVRRGRGQYPRTYAFGFSPSLNRRRRPY
jgi:hypothetical protein